MDTVRQIFTNPVLVASASSWLVAQVIKTILHLIVSGEFKAERLVGSGGMPSCHSATVCALATAAGIHEGVDSAVFAVAVMFAIVVMYDAMGVRRETGIQAEVINEMMNFFKEMGKSGNKMSAHEALKEFVGHTPIQVFVGAVIGILMAIVQSLVWF